MRGRRRAARHRAAGRQAGAFPALAAWIAVVPLLTGWSFFDPFHKNVEQGNKEAAEGNAETALQSYQEAARVDPGSPIPDFNRGIVLTREGQTQEAADAFLGAAAADDSRIAADAFYNLGNSLLEAEQYEPAVEAYLRSLDLDPADADARRNLEIALRRQEQQQQEQQQQDQNQDQQDDQEDDQENEDDQQNPGQQPPPEGEDPQQEEQPQSPDEDEPQDEQEQPQQPQPDKMSREDAERLLNAIQSDELKVLDQLQDGDEEVKGVVTDDW